jgi:hypothetical protein
MSTASNIINFQYIKVGTSTYSGNADPVNVAFRKINSNFADIANSLTNIIVPVASAINTGTVKIGNGINVAPDGTISVGQTVGIGAPANLTGGIHDAAGTLETSNSILYVSTGTFNPTFAISPNSESTGSNIVVTTSSYVAAVAQLAAQNYIPNSWVLYDTNYAAYPVVNLVYQQGTTPVTEFTLGQLVAYTTASIFYLATEDIWHRIPYIDDTTNALPPAVIPYQVGDIIYSLNPSSDLITTIGTDGGDLAIHPQGNLVVNVNSTLTGAVAIGGVLTVSTISSTGNLVIDPIGTISLDQPTFISSSTTIGGSLFASLSYTHNIGGIILGTMAAALSTSTAQGELLGTAGTQPDLYIVPTGNLYIGTPGRAVATTINGQTNITGGVNITGDQSVSGTSNARQFELVNIISTQSSIIDVIYHDHGNNFVITATNNIILSPSSYLDVTGQIRASDYVGAGSTYPASFSQGQIVTGASIFNNKWGIGNGYSMYALPGNTLNFVGGSGPNDGIILRTQSSAGTISITATNGSVVFGQGIKLKGGYGLTQSSISPELDLTDAAYIKVSTDTWKFDQYGQLTFPDATVQTTAFTGNVDVATIVVNELATLQKLTILTTGTVNGNFIVQGSTNLDSDLTVGGSAVITGNLTVLGNQTIVNSTSMQLEDPIIDIGTGPNGAALSVDDRLDKGLVFHYYDTANNRMFLGRDGASGRLILRNGIDAGIGVVSNSDYTLNGQWAGATFGNLILSSGVQATSTTTGDLQVAGGVGIGGNLYIGGSLNLAGSEVTIGGASFNNGLTLNGSVAPGAELFQINNGQGQVSFQVDSATGNTTILGTLNVVNTTQFVGVSSFQNNVSVAGDFNIATTKFNIASATGNTQVGGSLAVTGPANLSNNLNVSGTFDIGQNKFLVVGSSGNTQIAGTLNVAQTFTVNTNKFSVSSSTGNTTIAGTLDVTNAVGLLSNLNVTGATTIGSTLGVTGNLSVGATNFTVDSATGNVIALGTLDAYNDTTLHSSLTVSGAAYLNSTLNLAGGFAVNTNKFTVDANGNTINTGTLTVGGMTTIVGSTTINSALHTQGATVLDSLLSIGGNVSVNTNKFTVDSVTGNVVVAGSLSVTTGTTLSSTLSVAGATTITNTLAVSGNTVITSTTGAESQGLGALVVTGGASVGQKLQVVSDAHVGGDVYATKGFFSGNVTDNGNRVVTSILPSGSIGINISSLSGNGPAPSFTINNLGVISVTAGTETTVSAATGTNVAINVTSTLQNVTNRGASTTNAINITNGTASTTSTNGALTVAGGVGIQGNLNVGGTLNVQSGVTISGNIAGSAITDHGNRVVTSVVPSGSVGINISNLVSTGTATSFTVNNLGVVNLSGTQYNIVASAATGTVVLNLGNTGTAGTYAYPSSLTTDQFGRVNTIVANTATGSSGGQVLANYPTITSPTINGFPVLTNFTGYIYGNGSGQISSSVTLPGAVVTGTVPAAYTATVLTATQNFSISGDVSSPTVGFNGTAGVILNATLATVTQGSGNNFVKISLDTKGRVIGNTAVTALDLTGVLGATAVENASQLLTTAITTSGVYYNTFAPGTFSYQQQGVYTGYTFNPGTGVLTSPAVNITATTVSSTPTTGALTVAGGVGIAGNLNVQGSTYITGDLYVDGAQTYVNSTNIQTGDKVIYLGTASINATIAVGSGIEIGQPGNAFASFLFDGTNAWKSQNDLVGTSNGSNSLGYTTNQWSAVYGVALYDSLNRVLTDISVGTGTQVVTVGSTIRRVNIIPATAITLGGVKVGTGLSVAADGTITTNASAISTATFTSLGVIKVGNYLTTHGDGTVNLPQDIWTTSTVNFDTGVFTTQVDVGGNISVTNVGLVAQPGNGLAIEGGSNPGDSINIYTLNQSGQIVLTNYQASVTVNPQTVNISGGSGYSQISANEFDAEISVNGGVYQFSKTAITFPDNTTQTSAALTASTTATNLTLGYVKVGLNLNAAGDGTVSVSTATAVKAGTVKIGSGIYVATDGTISIPAGGGGVASITAGTGTHITASTGTPVVYIGQAVETTSAVTFASVTSTGAVTDNGNRVITSVTPTAGAGINISSLTSSGPSASFTINNLGVNSATGGTGVTVSQSTGAVTFSIGQPVATTNNVTFAGLTATNSIYATALYDSTNRVVTSVTPTAGTAINISSVTSTGPSTSFTINNLGVTALTGAPTIKVSASTGSITITDVGVTSIQPGTGITVNANTGSVTVTNAGVTAYNGLTGNVLGVSAVNGSTGSVLVVNNIAGSTYIGASASTGSVTLTNLGVQTITGTANQITASSATGTVTLSLPQSIATTSAVQFAGVTTGLTRVGYASVTAANYTISNTADAIIGVNYAGAVAITLPTVTGNTGRMLDIKDESGAANTNNITITPASGTIDGKSNLVLNVNYGSYKLYCNGGAWFII